MATIQAFTAPRQTNIEQNVTVDGRVDVNSLILTKESGAEVNVGSVRGPTGYTPPLRAVANNTELVLQTGTKTVFYTTNITVPFPVGSVVRVTSSTGQHWMTGVVTVSEVSRVTLTVTEFGYPGVATVTADWIITLAGFKGADGVITGSAGGVLSGTYPNPIFDDTGWVDLTLSNGWVPFDARTPQIRRRAGIVYFRGIIKNGPIGSVAFVVPAGYRPGNRLNLDGEQFFLVVSNNNYCSTYINASNGNYTIFNGSNIYVDLCNICWIAEN